MTRAELRKGPISWMARNPVAANLLMLGLIAAGIISSFRVRQEVFPQIDLDMITVTVPYPGASPAEVEQGILLAVEEAVLPLDGIKQVESTAVEGAGTVVIELELGTDRSKALTDVKNAIDRLRSLPLDAERPLVMAPEMKVSAISLVLYGDLEEKTLHSIAEQARDGLLAMDEISQVEIGGLRALEISVEVPQDTLRTYGLTLQQVAAQIQRTALEQPAGGVKTSAGEVLLRTAERRDLGMEFRDIPVVTASDGSSIPLSKLAAIRDGYAEQDIYGSFDGKPALFLNVYAVGEESPTEVADAAIAFSKQLSEQLPPGVSVTTWGDMSDLYRQRVDLLLRNAMLGLVLVLFILGAFLEPKLAFWVTMGIPISFLGSLILLPALGVSLNMISLFAFIITLGIVVDDAIVIGENIFRLRGQGMGRLQAAVEGAKSMAMPVFFSVATTVAAFSPLLFIPGRRGKFMNSIPIVVILVLTLSLIESFFVLPAHLAHSAEPSPRSPLGLLTRLQGIFSRAVERFIQRVYGPFVGFALRERWLAIAAGLAGLGIAAGLVAGGFVKVVDFPEEESDRIQVEAKLAFGVPLSDSQALLQKLVRTAHETLEANGGLQISKGLGAQLGTSEGSHVVQAWLTLVGAQDRPIGSAELARRWRKRLGEIPGLESLSFDSNVGRHARSPISLRLSHRDVKTLEQAAQSLAEQVDTYGGVGDVNDGIELGKPQLDFEISEEGVATGLTVADIASQVRGSFYGVEALRQQRGRHELRVLVRLPLEARRSLSQVEDLMIRTPTGGEIPLRRAATVTRGRAYSKITRTDGQRTLAVEAKLADPKANANEIMAALRKDVVPELKQRYAGLTVTGSGRQQDQREFFQYLKYAYVLALLGVFALIAIPLRSYLQPFFVVMMAIPFGVSGAIAGHLIMGIPISMISMMGMVALSGVVVNDSLVFVDAANRFRAEGMGILEAAQQAAMQRFRPILLTSVTTFGGLAPMIWETSVQARILIPMAVSLGFGILFSTAVVLLIVPSLFVVVEHVRVAWRGDEEADDDLDDGDAEEQPSQPPETDPAMAGGAA